MANLETLELTINGSAEKAGQGIDSLISRLSSLSSAITKPASDLRDFNSALKETAKLAKSVNFKNAGKGIGAAVAKGVGATPTKKNLFPTAEQIKASYAKQEQLNKANALPPEAFRAQQEVSKRIIQERMAATIAKRQAFEMKQQAKAQAQISEEVKNTTSAQEENTSALGKIKTGFKNVTSGAATFFGRVKRIATTMLIRSAIRGLIRDMKEGVSNLYEWSKLNNGEFAKSFDTIKAKGEQLKNSVGAAIAPAIQAAIPVLNALTNAAITAFNWVNQLLSLLTGKGYWTRATANVDSYADSVNKAGGAAQQWLAAFDELNVMTSGGGGGGGGASTEYADMFENVYTFDSKLKDITEFLKDNFESIKAMAVATGVAIMGWKISQGFADVLPMLSKIAGLIGVGAVIGITLQADWLLTNKYLQTGEEGWLIASALTTAVGSVAAYAIAKQIFKGKAGMYAAGFTLALSAATDIIANLKNTNVDALSKESLLTSLVAALKAGGAAGIFLYAGGMSGLPLLAAAGGIAALTFLVSVGLKAMTSSKSIKWGNFEATQKQINDFVLKEMFTTDVNAMINQINLVIDKKEDLETSIGDQLTAINTEFNILKLGIDTATSYQNIADMIGDENTGLVKKIADLCDVNVSLLKLNVGNIQMFDGEGNAMSTDILLTGMQGWSKIKDQMETNGKELTELLLKGARGELTPEMEKYTQELLEKVTHMSEKITQATEFGSAMADFKENILAAFTSNSFDDIITAFNDYSSSYEETIRKSLKKTIADWYSLAALEEDDELKAKYIKIADDLSAGFEKTVSEELNKQTEPGKEMIREWLKNSVDIQNWSGIDYWVGVLEEQGFNADTFNLAIATVMRNNGNGKVVDVANLIGFSGWTFLTNDLKKKFIQNVKITKETIKELAKAEVPATELVELVDWDNVKNMAQKDFVNAITAAYGSQGISAIRDRFPNIKASQILEFSAWDEFTNRERLNFLDAIEKSFGVDEATSAAKKAGKDVEIAIREGMESQDEDIRKQAKKWADLIGVEIKSGDYTVEPEVKQKTVDAVANIVKTGIEKIQPVVDKVTAQFKDGTLPNLVASIMKLNATVQPSVIITDAVKNAALAAVQAIKPTIMANVVATGTDEFAKKIKSALKTTLKLTFNGGTLGTITMQTKAGGGLVSSGDMFIANENGVPEMIGRFGNQTGVANTGQIVAGISKGVSDANREQNALLREQNALLRGILEKTGKSGFPGASSSLGRVVRQSLNMYDGVTGG